MDSAIHQILAELRDDKINNRNMGDKFERLIQAFLGKDPYFADLFSDVWLWMEWPDRKGKVDTGIDIVAKERATGEHWAIQCKFLDPNSILQKSDIDSFFTASGKKPFARRMIISTAKAWSKHAQDARDEQQIPVSTLDVNALAESAIDWSEFSLRKPGKVTLKTKKKLREHQRDAHADVIKGFKSHDRGKLIMACGTGKTFTALKIAEAVVPKGGTVLFLVPSISLISQTLTEWSNECERPLHSFAVCSDPKVGRNETEDISTRDLAFPAHTNAKQLAKQFQSMGKVAKGGMFAIFSTYQSIAVVAESQKSGLPEFDLIICDEAHRTTGVERDDKDASAFTRVHDAKFIKAARRLYMTATPRIYDDASKSKAKEAEVEIFSMDDEATYGSEFHRLDFSEAVRRDLLSDYKVMVLAVDEKHVSKALQSQLADKNREFTLPDAVKIVGCWNGLRKRMVSVVGDNTAAADPEPMRRGVAFSQTIKASQSFTGIFARIIEEYQSATMANPETADGFLKCEVHHVDGTMNAMTRNSELRWLKEDTAGEGNVCRLLSNARCLSEGVDVPALDAVMFLNPRNSVVDVVQSVGRVMRKAPGKQFGYIILPIGIPADMEPADALADNQKYKVVWQVLQALRAHDDRFNAIINKLDLNNERPEQIQVIGVGDPKDGSKGGSGAEIDDTQKPKAPQMTQLGMTFPQLDNWKDAIFAKIVIKCGTRKYWETWAKDIAEIAERHITRIKALLESSNAKYRKEFGDFLEGLRKTLNPSIDQQDAIEMLAQHLVTKPVFDALFEGYDFTEHNPVSIAMQKMLDLLYEQNIEKESETLEKFYASVRERASGIDNAEGKQKIIIELYDKFFKTAFPRMAERLGIVYTPTEIVDFIIKSADWALRNEFKVGLTDNNVHILDPFTGTGTFIVRLLQSGLIETKDLKRKYAEELHANEIILLAYYIAAVNIEAAYHGAVGGNYTPFDGIVLTDTFQMTESAGTLLEKTFPENNERVVNQNRRDIRVIVANPPYSAGQTSQNDANQNLRYQKLDQRISETYAERSSATNKNRLYDSYIRALRWASDRVNDSGIICYVSNGSYIDGTAMDGVRSALTCEFSAVYCFNLRGNQRTSGEVSRQEGGKIFGSGSRAQIAITLLVKDVKQREGCRLYYHDIGDYLSREAKLKIISDFGSAGEIPWAKLTPNDNNDWINQRDPAFEKFHPLGDKGGISTEVLFDTYSVGLQSARDAWAYNFGKTRLKSNMQSMIEFYNAQTVAYEAALRKKRSGNPPEVEDVIDNDSQKISWTRGLKNDLRRLKTHVFNSRALRPSMYRPFCKQWVYFDRNLCEYVSKTPSLFPSETVENVGIYVSGIGGTKESSAIMVDCVPDLNMQHSIGQCFPLAYYEAAVDGAKLFNSSGDIVKRDGITDKILSVYRSVYGKELTKDDIFYYVYGILHSPEYKRRFASDLKKMLPRIPFAADFWAFSEAGRKLADLHLNYESAKPYAVKQSSDRLALDKEELYKVQKMYFGKPKVKGGPKVDKTTIVYNSHITITAIPLEAYEYVVNGKPAIEWITERYQITKDKDSGIVNDPNDWATEHEDAEYILRLLKSIITVSLETMKIVKGLPALEER